PRRKRDPSSPIVEGIAMDRFNRLFVFLTLCLAAPSFAAEPTNLADPAINKAVVASLDATRKMDWNAYADLIHPESLQAYQKMWLPILEDAKDKPDRQAELLPLFDKPNDVKRLMALKPREFFIRSMKAMTANSTFPKFPGKSTQTILGTVREGTDLAHV